MDTMGLLASDLSEVGSSTARREFLRARHRQSAVPDLPDVMAEAMVECRDAQGRVKPLALDVAHLHAQQKGATNSVLRSKAQAWLSSDPGKRWQEEKAQLLAADDGGNETVPAVSEKEERNTASKAKRRKQI